MDFKFLTLEQKDGVATITLNRPDAFNALSLGLGRDLFHGLGHLPARDTGHRQIGEHHVERLRAELLDSLGAVGQDDDAMAAGLEHVAEHPAHLGLVVHHQTPERHAERR